MALWSEKVADVIGLIGASFGSLIVRGLRVFVVFFRVLALLIQGCPYRMHIKNVHEGSLDSLDSRCWHGPL